MKLFTASCIPDRLTMCYSPPGPRCSYHAQKELQKAVTLLDTASQKGTASTAELSLLESRVDTAQTAYYSTIRGQNDLLREIGNLAGQEQNNPALAEELEAKRELYQTAVATRKQQLSDYKTFKLNKTNKKKSQRTQPTRNKQQIASDVLEIALTETYPDLAVEQLDSRLMGVQFPGTDTVQTIAVIPQKQQSLLTNLPDDTVPLRLQKGLDKELIVKLSNIPRDNRFAITRWVVDSYKEQGVEFYGSVDIKLETAYIAPIDSLSSMYDISFKQVKRRGGTYVYPHGDTPLLQENLQDQGITGEVFMQANPDGGRQRTFIKNLNKLLTAREQHLDEFFLSPKTDEITEETYYEVRKKHDSANYDLFLVLERKQPLIPMTDFTKFAINR